MIDEAELVHVAAAATGLGPDALLAGCDVRALASVVAEVEAATTTHGAAASLLVAMHRHRPFPTGNVATAWLGAAHLLASEGLRLHVGPATARSLATAGDLAAVEEVLGVLARPRRGFLRWWFEPRTVAPPMLPCPTCGRLLVLRRGDVCLLHGPWSLSADVELRARCAVSGGPHTREGRPRRELVTA